MRVFWKENWAESRQHYLDWWAGKGLVISMWELLEKDGAPHEAVEPPVPARDWGQFWFDPEWRADDLHYSLARSSFIGDILPVANTHLGPGSLAAILGSELEGSQDTIWIRPRRRGARAPLSPWMKTTAVAAAPGPGAGLPAPRARALLRRLP